MKYKGVDVSAFQGDINWPEVVNYVTFAMIRATYGQSGVDSKFKKNILSSNRAGIHAGVYHYTYARTMHEAAREANHLINTLSNYEITYPVALDIEENSLLCLGKEKVTNIILEFMNRLKDSNYYPILYTTENWLQKYVNISQIPDIDLWLAKWDSHPTYKYNNLGIWQYTNNGRVNGIGSNVNLNISYKNYNHIIKNSNSNSNNLISPNFKSTTANKFDSDLIYEDDMDLDLPHGFNHSENGINFEAAGFYPSEYPARFDANSSTNFDENSQNLSSNQEIYDNSSTATDNHKTTSSQNSLNSSINTENYNQNTQDSNHNSNSSTTSTQNPTNTEMHTTSSKYANINSTKLSNHDEETNYISKNSNITTWNNNNNTSNSQDSHQNITKSVKYRVKPGDTLWAIAQKYLGSGSKFIDIKQINNLNTDQIHPGQILDIPQNSNTDWNLYTVQRGDSIWKISQKLLNSTTKVNEIMNLNKLTNDVIYPGQILKIPKKTTTTTTLPKSYTIKKGDTLSEIARKFLGDPKKYINLIKFNNLTNTTIRPGQRILIPSA
ncbi:MAG: LysM peptidoglycan-binding domain-containing protein [Candidatus Improbicoccus devescovinae]|nr:MAG: LysM peptidoglycan-binding domain-containing protein [Candidatus Improbicoccus devescovinae]